MSDIVMIDFIMIVISCVFLFMFAVALLGVAACMNSSRISRLEETFYENRESKNNN